MALRSIAEIFDLQKGQILRCRIDNDFIQKTKRFILARYDSQSQQVKIIFINSRMTEFARKRPEIRDRHIPIDPSDYPSLDHLSYINCSSVDFMELKTVLRLLRTNSIELLGCLTNDHLTRLVGEVQQAQTVKKKDKRVVAAPIKFSGNEPVSPPSLHPHARQTLREKHSTRPTMSFRRSVVCSPVAFSLNLHTL